MHDERDFLLNTVEPQINAQLTDLNVNVEFCDFRWGIDTRQSGSDSSRTIFDACFGAIETCKPIFLGLLGQRYGWVSQDQAVHQLLKNKFDGSIPLDRSVTEYEIRYALKVSKSLGLKTIFLFRQLEDNPPSQTHTDESVDWLPKLDSLKNLIKEHAPEEDIRHYVAQPRVGNPIRYELKNKNEITEYLIEKIVSAAKQHISDEMTVNPLTISRDGKVKLKSYEVKKIIREASGGKGTFSLIRCVSDRNCIEALFELTQNVDTNKVFPIATLNAGVDNHRFSVLSFLKYCIFLCDNKNFKSFGFYNWKYFGDTSRLKFLGVEKNYTVEVKSAARELLSKVGNRVLLIVASQVDLLPKDEIVRLISVLKISKIKFSIISTTTSGLATESAFQSLGLKVTNVYDERFILPSIKKRIVTDFFEGKLKAISETILEKIMVNEFSDDIEWVELALARISNLSCDDYLQIYASSQAVDVGIYSYQSKLLDTELNKPATAAFESILLSFFDAQGKTEQRLLTILFDALTSHQFGLDLTRFKRFFDSSDFRHAIYIFDVFSERFSVALYFDNSGCVNIKSIYLPVVYKLIAARKKQELENVRKSYEPYWLLMDPNHPLYSKILLSVSFYQLNKKVFERVICDDLAILTLDVEDALTMFFRLSNSIISSEDNRVNMLCSWLSSEISLEFLPIFLDLAKRNINNGAIHLKEWCTIEKSLSPIVDDSVVKLHRSRWCDYYKQLSNIESYFSFRGD